MPDQCPLADKLFDDLAAGFRDGAADDPDGVTKVTMELFIEQFSAAVLDRELAGIGRLTRDVLEEILAEGELDEKVAEVVATTIDGARELSAQAYAEVPGFLRDYVAPWLERIKAWLDVSHPGCPCLQSVASCLELM